MCTHISMNWIYWLWALVYIVNENSLSIETFVIYYRFSRLAKIENEPFTISNVQHYMFTVHCSPPTCIDWYEFFCYSAAKKHPKIEFIKWFPFQSIFFLSFCFTFRHISIHWIWSYKRTIIKSIELHKYNFGLNFHILNIASVWCEYARIISIG